MNTLLLRNWPFFGKVGLTSIVLVFGMGLAASLQHIVNHYQNRDARPGLTRDDVVAAYHGLTAPSPLLAAADGSMNDGRHARIPDPALDALRKWLKSDKVAENFDNMDFTDPTAREILAQNCAKCHSTRADPTVAGAAASLPLENWTQVAKYAFERKVERTPDRVKTISTHTHALSLATMSAVIAVLALLTTWPRGLVGLFLAAMGLGLCADIAGWWLTNWYAWAVDLIIAGGAAYNGATAILLIGIVLNTWLPKRA